MYIVALKLCMLQLHKKTLAVCSNWINQKVRELGTKKKHIFQQSLNNRHRCLQTAKITGHLKCSNLHRQEGIHPSWYFRIYEGIYLDHFLLHQQYSGYFSMKESLPLQDPALIIFYSDDHIIHQALGTPNSPIPQGMYSVRVWCVCGNVW